ncbi:MAG TPA: DUF2934 domain-containing protein [Steroidobacteraceae bacterium]|nr:DUF2934 domain-containing protein [Steroidobacteraceae bacterium]
MPAPPTPALQPGVAAPGEQARREVAIRRDAYFRWAYRGCTPREELTDWLAAERDVDGMLTQREKMIREAAYFRWQNRGHRAGEELDDWLAAEREVDAMLEHEGILEGFCSCPH